MVGHGRARSNPNPLSALAGCIISARRCRAAARGIRLRWGWSRATPSTGLLDERTGQHASCGCSCLSSSPALVPGVRDRGTHLVRASRPSLRFVMPNNLWRLLLVVHASPRDLIWFDGPAGRYMDTARVQVSYGLR